MSFFLTFVWLFLLWEFLILPSSNSIFLVLGTLDQGTRAKKILIKICLILEQVFHQIGFIPFCFLLPMKIYVPISFGIRFFYVFTVWYCNRKPPTKKKEEKKVFLAFSWPNPVPTPAFNYEQPN